jgi:hypothetical protein
MIVGNQITIVRDEKARADGASILKNFFATKKSRRAEAVETSGIICPSRVAEIGRVVGANEYVERVGSHH